MFLVVLLITTIHLNPPLIFGTCGLVRLRVRIFKVTISRKQISISLILFKFSFLHVKTFPKKKTTQAPLLGTSGLGKLSLGPPKSYLEPQARS